MTREKIIKGLKFTVQMFSFDPTTGETITESRNPLDKITIDACKGAIELLEQEPKSPCDACKYNPPGSGDGKPCTMCPAEAESEDKG